MGFFDIMKSVASSLSSDKDNILEKPGDSLSARVTNSNRQVLKISKDNGSSKYSATRYPNGTIVETKVTKNK